MTKKRLQKQLCLVTGGAGFIGSHLVDGLLTEGYRVRVLDNFSTGKKKNLKSVLKKIQLIRGDLRNDRDVARAVKDVTYVFHVAAIRAVLQSVEKPLEVNDVNVTGTLRLLVACRKAGVKRVIFSSSSSVYGNTKNFPTKETNTPAPESPYASSKIMGEYYCRNFWNLFGLETVVLRYFNVFGPRQDPKSKYAAVIPLFIESLSRKQPLKIHWDGKQSRGFCYVSNVVKASLLAMKAPEVAGEVFNISGPQESSLLQTVKELRDIMSIQKAKLFFKPKRSGDIRRSCADLQKSARLLGYRGLVSFREGLERTVDWFLKNPGSF